MPMLSLLAPSRGSVPAKIRMLRSGWSFWSIEEYSRFFASYLASGSTWTYVLGNLAQQALPLSDQVTLEVRLVGSSRTDTITVKSNLIIAKHITHGMESCHTGLESPGLGTSPMLQPSLIASASLNWAQMELISMLRIPTSRKAGGSIPTETGLLFPRYVQGTNQCHARYFTFEWCRPSSTLNTYVSSQWK